MMLPLLLRCQITLLPFHFRAAFAIRPADIAAAPSPQYLPPIFDCRHVIYHHYFVADADILMLPY